jgi:cell division protease FtsH
MATKWGLTEALGPLTYSEEEDEVFLGRSVTQHKHVSDETARKIDVEIRRIIETAHNHARELLKENIEILHLMAKALLKYETIDTKQIDQLMDGNDPDPPAGWSDSDESQANSDASRSSKADDEDGKRSAIGGPAEQH